MHTNLALEAHKIADVFGDLGGCHPNFCPSPEGFLYHVGRDRKSIGLRDRFLNLRAFSR